MDPQKQQASDRIKQANNILVTVSSNPSVDQLAACIGLTVALNKMGKHATAVFSGAIPPTLEFLQPEKTIEKNTDSLRDFIIALDKSKADKLRYKVEDRVVKIFITPYRTSISDKDLEFSQGDFNVDVVLALGVHSQADLDRAITSHGRILHDATIMTMNIQPGGELGSINWLDPNASSLSEQAVQLVDLLDKKLIDSQTATAFLTGIVAETDRFSNSKTSPQTMSISAELMGAGANQQLVATKLEEPAPPPPPAPIVDQQAPAPADSAQPKKSDDGTLEISHIDDANSQKARSSVPLAEATDEKTLPEPQLDDLDIDIKPIEEPAADAEPDTPAQNEEPAPPPPQIHINEHGELESEGLDAFGLPPRSATPPAISHHDEPPKMVLQPPTLGGPLNAASASTMGESEREGTGLPDLPKEEDVSLPPSMHDDKPAIGSTITPPSEDEQNAPGTSFLGDQPIVPDESPKDKEVPSVKEPTAGETLSEIEQDVHSSHVAPMLPPVPQTAGDAPSVSLPPFERPTPSNMDTSPGGVPAPTLPGTTLPTNPSSEQNQSIAAIPDMPVGQNVQDIATTPSADAPTTPESTNDSSSPLDDARNAVAQAISDTAPAPQAVQALNAQPLADTLNPQPTAPAPQQPLFNTPPLAPPPPDQQPVFNPPVASPAPPQPGQPQEEDPNAPPPVPPPMMPPMPQA